MASKQVPSGRCGCGYRHAHIQHVCDRGKARAARQGVFVVMSKDRKTVYNEGHEITDVARALEFAKKRNGMVAQGGVCVFQLIHEEPAREIPVK